MATEGIVSHRNLKITPCKIKLLRDKQTFQTREGSDEPYIVLRVTLLRYCKFFGIYI